MANESKICEHCGRAFSLCPFNKHHQRFCKAPSCRQDRARARKRKSYNTRYREDAEFQETERKRCRKSLNERRKKARKKPPPTQPSTLTAVDLDLVVAGLLAHSLETSDHHDVLSLAREYEAWGQALTMGTALAAPNAVLPLGRTVPRHSLSPEKAVPRHSLSAAPP